MLFPHVLHVAEPVVAQAQSGVLQRRPHAAAAVVPGDDDVPHLEHIHRELEDRETVEIGVHDQVGDVPMHEQLARIEADDLVGRDPAVGAADPEVCGGVLRRQAGEELGVLLPPRGGPRAVVGKQILKKAHGLEADRPRAGRQARRCNDVQHESP